MQSDIEKYLAWCKSKYAAPTLEDKTKHLNFYCRWLINNQLHYQNVTQPIAEKFLLSYRWSGNHRNKTKFTLHNFYLYSGIPSPFENIPLSKEKKQKLPKLPAKCSIQKIIDKIKSRNAEFDLRNKLMIEFAYGSGLRRKELILLNVEDIDITGRSAFVTGKGDKQRNVPLTRNTIDLLRKYLSYRKHLRPSGPLFQNIFNGARLDPDHVSRLFSKLTGHTTHSFRHACATHMLANGCNLRYIQKLLGHNYLSTTQIYTHVDRTQLSKIVQQAHPRAKQLLFLIINNLF